MKSENLNNQVKENLVATLRALIGNDSLVVEFDAEVKENFFAWNQNLVKEEAGKKWGEGGIFLPEVKGIESEILSPVIRRGDKGEERGDKREELGDKGEGRGGKWKSRAAADLAACYLLFHNPDLHLIKNHAEEEQKFFDEFEKIRVISCVKNSYRGVAKNILEKLESDIFALTSFEKGGGAKGGGGLELILLKEVFAEKILPQTAKVAEELEQNLNAKIVKEIKNLAKILEDQVGFEALTAKILEMLKEDQNSQEKEQSEKDSSKKLSEKNDKKKNELNSFGQENIDAEVPENFLQNQEESGEKKFEPEQKIADFKDSDEKGEVTLRLENEGQEDKKIEWKNPYKVYSTKFDEIIFPQKLVEKKELEFLRDQLDLKMARLNSISKKMTLKLKRKLLSKRNSFVETGAAAGILNRKKLTRLVTDPLAEDIWISSKNHEYQNTCLTILLDNSGSMRGNPIVMSALACEIIAEILEKFSIKTEIIGFTTADWKGGKARKLWESSGRPKNPGRLNELRHIIYKHFNQRFSKAKINLGLMLKEGLLKENIDGEALLFARSRLAQQSEKRKILLVISDGTPVDDSTNSANDRDILTDHLHHVIQKIENAPSHSRIEIVGIGIGHTTDEFYRNSIAIKSLEELGDVMIEKVVGLL